MLLFKQREKKSPASERSAGVKGQRETPARPGCLLAWRGRRSWKVLKHMKSGIQNMPGINRGPGCTAPEWSLALAHGGGRGGSRLPPLQWKHAAQRSSAILEGGYLSDARFLQPAFPFLFFCFSLLSTPPLRKIP